MFILDHKPQSLSEIVGQEYIVKELKGRSAVMEFPQAMLFSGPTGSGKTTTCHIIAALLNCKKPKKERDGLGNEFMSPCLECDSCLSVWRAWDKSRRDIHVYDGATLNKDKFEKLFDSILYMPFDDENRIVVIEEFQEILSRRSYGPLYTLLDEKRKNFYIFFLSMDISKVPDALQDRCAHYEFRSVPVPSIVIHLRRILETKGLTSVVPDFFIGNSLSILAENANGSVRRAVQLLEHCIRGEIYSKNLIQKAFGLDESA